MGDVVQIGEAWRARRTGVVVDVRRIESGIVYFRDRATERSESASLEAFVRLFELVEPRPSEFVAPRPERAQGTPESAGPSGAPLDGDSTRTGAPSPAEGALAREINEALSFMLEQGFVETESEPDGEIRIRLTEAGMAYYEERFVADARDRLR